jgi:diguanylate cyclase (GGDEF)-like protein
LAIVRKITFLLGCLNLLLVCTASVYVMQTEYETALDAVVTESLARIQDHPDIPLFLQDQDTSSLNAVLEDLSQPPAVSVAAVYDYFGEMLTKHADADQQQLSSLKLAGSILSEADISSDTLGNKHQLPDSGFWQAVTSDDSTIFLTTTIYSPTSSKMPSQAQPESESTPEPEPEPSQVTDSTPNTDEGEPDQPKAEKTPVSVVVPEEPEQVNAVTIYRVNVGGPDYTDANNNVWAADSFYNTGWRSSEPTGDVANTSDPTLYRSSRWDKLGGAELTYILPVPNGLYTVLLHFAELYEGASTPGSRIFAIEIEGLTVAPEYDIAADVGFRTAAIKEFSNIEVTDRYLDIEFLHVLENPTLSAIEVVEYSAIEAIENTEPEVLQADGNTTLDTSPGQAPESDGQEAGVSTETEITEVQIGTTEGDPNIIATTAPQVEVAAPETEDRDIEVGFLQLGFDTGILLRESAIATSRVFIGGLLLVFLGTLAFYLIIRRALAPLAKLGDMADQISSGESVQKIDIAETGVFASVAKLLNGVIEESAKRKIEDEQERKRLAEKVDESASQLSQREQELNKATEEISSSREKLHRLANYDHVTSLPNRNLFTEQLDLLLRLSARNGKPLAVLLLSVADFKRINESLGRSAGDQLLREAGKRLNQCMRSSDILAHNVDTDENLHVSRLSSDAFAMVLNEIDDARTAGAVAMRIADQLAEPMQIDGHELIASSNIGIAVAPGNGTNAEDLLRAATIANEHSRTAKRNFLYYAEDMLSTAQDDLRIEAELRKAIERNQLILHYQPQVDTVDGSITSAKALLRWEHPELGTVPPASFIRVAENIGIMGELDDWVLLEACRQMNAFRELGLDLPRIAITVSPQQFNLEFVQRLKQALATADLPPSMLELGLSEAVLMDNDNDVLDFVKELKNVGVTLSLENFGTGHAPLSYLGQHPLDEIKIDRNFVINCDTRKDRGSLVKAIIAMSESLGLRTVAEGVETEGEYQFLTDSGIRIMRGYLFSQPLPAAELQEKLEVPWYFMNQIQRIALAKDGALSS